ncbi:dimethylarginine dimethylaminohydrolase family protein [[Bacillus] enclensis]|uniref:dimethylarginine dimethylaminohydrolase family protein n=1 Tax=[Bacillus] enclensis TaxID=1402860 RepID=UPI0018DD3FFC|nr:dimethylarginine dimethylaminohydrolase family protein [[Bacillus] enclensis]MBH9965243.1 dimethylarginine dimethylaminohydrolase family protein [[Bacillus] enclensis]
MKQIQLSCPNEFSPLKEVILCEPTYMKIQDIINETQRRYHKENIYVDRAVEQHNKFHEILRENNITTHLLSPKNTFPEQVFTRDIGFTVGRTLFISDMKMPVRQGEEIELRNWLSARGMSYIDLVEDETEGGDVLVHWNTVYIGLSDRTTFEAVERIQSYLPDYNVIPLPIHEDILHLDCIFNIISDNEALIYREGLRGDDITRLSSQFDLIDVCREEQFTMGVNVLSIGNKKVISLPINKGVNKELRDRGFEVIEVEFDEIIKSGGSFRCCTLPLLRG